MRCIGWDDRYWKVPRAEKMTLEEMELWVNIAGNSYCIWHFLPWYLSLLGTYGKYLNDNDPAEMVEVSDQESDAKDVVITNAI